MKRNNKLIVGLLGISILIFCGYWIIDFIFNYKDKEKIEKIEMPSDPICPGPHVFRLEDGRSITIPCDLKPIHMIGISLLLVDTTKNNPFYWCNGDRIICLEEYDGTHFKLKDGRFFSIPCKLSVKDSTNIQNELNK